MVLVNLVSVLYGFSWESHIGKIVAGYHGGGKALHLKVPSKIVLYDD
jgi:hypothetical protein